MKILVATALLAAAVGLPHADARSATPSSLIGKWTVDISRLPVPLEARPKSVTIAFSEFTGGKWTMSVDIIDAGGAAIHAGGTVALDGTPTAVVGPEADTAA